MFSRDRHLWQSSNWSNQPSNLAPNQVRSSHRQYKDQVQFECPSNLSSNHLHIYLQTIIQSICTYIKSCGRMLTSSLKQVWSRIWRWCDRITFYWRHDFNWFEARLVWSFWIYPLKDGSACTCANDRWSVFFFFVIDYNVRWVTLF